ncbi:hypothetical protein FOCC_FOCC011178 [Frankliniella occidentalis]|uniref:Chromatin assembly factor 1 subunit A-B-like isoform X1 n=1 Tax=Frankliniella occidentalis TaxID=133901 RepID=A0A6J1T8K0_FRAOC|nr:chromatin assembly factor 1 subunit A-B-like isoform X1 [Frankliniella occidentalis]XP_026288011.1 chromatin assembly factor 1 subunit A-B-like isoform X1 [Frankliniella occidentalis]KAE8743243.1 hypothetical protein FOCC_FOCC011178 [Frankliniella occidentalis]
MDSDSPPRKKLKQARLPFQILSPKDTVTEATPPTNRKRQLSEDSNDDDVVVKIGKKSEEYKENNTVEIPVAENNDKELAQPISEDVTEVNLKNETTEIVQEETPNPVTKECGGEQGNILQNKMKSTLANLLGKKVFDVTEDVGSCDCGCEEADSGDEAIEEYMAHCIKRKLGSDSTEKTPKEKPKRKSGHRKSVNQASPTKGSPSAKQKGSSKKSQNKSPAVKKADSIETDEPKSSDIESKSSEVMPEQETAKTPTRKESSAKSSILSQKTYDMFAKWRKEPSSSSNKNESTSDSSDLPSKEKENLGEGREGVVLDEGKNTTASNEIKAISISRIELKGTNQSIKEESKPSIIEGGSKCLNELEVSETNAKNKTVPEIVLDEGSKDCESPIKQVSNQSKESPGHKNQPGSTECPINIESEKPTFPITPTGMGKAPQRRLTPKQVERLKKQEEKEKQKLERENEKKRLQQEKDELKKKEKEEKEEQKRKEKEEKEKKKLADLEQKNEEKKKKELQKAEEKRKKIEERKKAEEDKKKSEEEEERKKAKASALFTSFFVPKSSKAEKEEALPSPSTVQNFMPFEIKAGMRMAPKVRHTLSCAEKQCLDKILEHEVDMPKDSLYLNALKSGGIIPKLASKTWPVTEVKEDDDISILESDDYGVLVENTKKVEVLRAKFLQFHENHRPAYRGTWRKRSNFVTGRRPFGQEKILDYEFDSADEWEEEEPGESLHGSDDEKEKESEDEYEVDNSIFVPHGYLSDDEGDGDEESEEVFSPETQKAKLKLLGEEFEAQMKSKTSALKPVIIVLTAALQASSLGSVRYQKLLERRAVWQEDDGPIVLSKLKNDNAASVGLGVSTSDPNCMTFSSGPGAKKKIISEEALPALITLVHGNQNKRVFLTNEFSAFLDKSRSVNLENTQENPSVNTNALEECDRPSTPSVCAPNPLALKWPDLPRASRISISNKIKELAAWGPCPDEGPLHNRLCWYVAEETRAKYGVSDIKLPNTLWHYTLKPKVFNHSQSPIASSSAVADSRALITKFTKVMTPEEKQRQWKLMENTGNSTPSSSKLTSSKGSTGKITAFTQQTKTPSSADPKQCMPVVSQPGNASVTPSSSQPPAKKRVPLLVSVPRGQQITGSSSHCSLLSKFEASTSSKSIPSSTSVPSDSSQTTSGSDSAKQISSPSSNSTTHCTPEDEIVLD